MKRITNLIFDVDNTLYPSRSGLLNAMSERITTYIMNWLDVPYERARQMRVYYNGKYGATLPALVKHHGVDSGDYFSYLCDIDYLQYLSYDGELFEMLSGLPHRKVIYTNASVLHARNVMRVLGITGLFDCIVGAEEVLFHTKPSAQGFREMIRLTGIPACRSLFFDDQLNNIIAAKRFGLRTAHIEGNSHHPDVNIDKITDFDISLLYD